MTHPYFNNSEGQYRHIIDTWNENAEGTSFKIPVGHLSYNENDETHSSQENEHADIK